jgi:CDP-diacylglycerol--glycerol-3-phosphate 3-phosphatidyltransferase
MLGRANLNSSYFTDRQDRYLRFRSHTEFAQYCRDFLRKSSTFSYRLLPSSSQSSAPYDLHWPDPHTHPHHLEIKAKQALTELQSAWIEKSRARPPPLETEVLLFPVIQAGQFGIREEEQAVGLIFDQLTRHQTDNGSMSPSVDLTSGYFGLSKLYQNLVLQSGIHTRLLCASPQVRRQPWSLPVPLIVALHHRQMGSTTPMVSRVVYPKHIHT